MGYLVINVTICLTKVMSYITNVTSYLTYGVVQIINVRDYLVDVSEFSHDLIDGRVGALHVEVRTVHQVADQHRQTRTVTMVNTTHWFNVCVYIYIQKYLTYCRYLKTLPKQLSVGNRPKVELYESLGKMQVYQSGLIFTHY